MSDEQFAAIREGQLVLVSTLFDGTLVVREPEGGLLELDRDGDLQPHLERAGRVTAELPATAPGQSSHSTVWAPKTEKIHKRAQEKLGTKADTQMVRHEDL